MADARSSIDRQKGGKAIVTVTVSPEIAQAAERTALERLGSRVNVKGFRPGKAPESVIREKIDPDALFEETVRVALRSEMPRMLKDHDLRPVVPPRVEAVSREPLTLRVTFIERPPVMVKHAEKLAPAKEPLTVDPKDIDRVVQSAVAEHRTFASVDRPAQKGDRVIARFSAVDKDGNDIPGLHAESERIVLGESRLLPGFEDALEGVSAGQEKTFTLTLPDKFPAEQLRNAPAIFTVHVQSVESVTTPAFDDAFAKEKLRQPSAQAFRDMVERSIGEQEEQFRRMSRERKLLDAIREHTQADLADELIDQELQQLVEEWAQRLEQQGKSVEDALKAQGKTAKQVEEELRAEARNRWLLRLGIAQLIEEKKLELTPEEDAQAIEAFLDNLRDDDRSEAEERIRAKDALYDEVRWRALVDKLIAALLA